MRNALPRPVVPRFAEVTEETEETEEPGQVAESPTRLGDFTAVRVYHVRTQDAAEVEAAVRRAFPMARLEMIRAELCRADLLVEIEGVAQLPGTQDGKGG